MASKGAVPIDHIVLGIIQNTTGPNILLFNEKIVRF